VQDDVVGYEGFQPGVKVQSAAESEAELRAAGRWDAHVAAKAARKAEEAAAKMCSQPGVTCSCDPMKPCTLHKPVLSEQEKYQKMWEFPQYRQVAPGEDVAQLFLQIAKPRHDAEVIDFGAGTGRGALSLAFFGGLRVKMLDFAANCLDEDVRNATQSQPERMSFVQHDLMKEVPFSAEYGYCTDVMEHIPPDDVDTVLMNVLRAAQHVFFQISCVDDVCGKLIGAPLHLTVKPHDWWLKKFQDLGCVVHWSKDLTHSALFYVTAWQAGTEVVKHGVLNNDEKQLVQNVVKNLRANWQEVRPYETNDMEVMILGGGPSLAICEATIMQMRAEGKKLVTLNGTYNWALEHGLTPSATVVVDSREFNKRFVQPVVPDCKYLISSQCHPELLRDLPKDRTFLWHTGMESIREIVNAERSVWYQVPGGSTVMLRAIPLLRMLGFKKFHLFGFDSCLSEPDAGEEVRHHHAYAQPENDNQAVIPVNVSGRQFMCHPWMISQAQEFQDLVKFLGSEIELEVYGDGLISHILTTGAALADEQDSFLK